MEIDQGDIFRFDAGEPRGSSPAYSRPVVVIQNNVFNRSWLGSFGLRFDDEFSSRQSTRKCFARRERSNEDVKKEKQDNSEDDDQ